MNQRRVVITGLGAVTPIGSGVDTFWKAALDCTNGVQPLQSIDVSEFKTKVGGEVKDFDAAAYLSPSEIASMGRSSQFAVAAARMAMQQSGLDMNKEDPYRVSVSVGTTMGEPQILEQGVNIKYQSGADAIPATLPAQYPCGAIPANIARAIGAKGPNMIIPTACAAGNYAIGYGLDMIRLGRTDCVISGGSDPFSRIAFTGFNRLLATAERCVRPFSKNRDGMAVAEGAGMLILEELEHAKRRGAPILAEVLGYGLACDAFKMTIPSPTGEGGIRSLRRALQHSQISADAIDYVSAHGTGTGENDKSETLIVKTVLGERAYSVPMTSLKSMLGHTMGAASAIEAVSCVLMLQHNVILPTINYEEADAECDLDYVTNQPREAVLNTVVSNAFAFAGNTSSLVLRRFQG
jgi:3-oxoacyl-[acyl-carrier-protein] synthase II